MSVTILNNLAFQPFGWDDGIKKSIYVPITWASGLQVVVDTTINNQLLEMKNIQSVFCSNTATSSITITVSGTNFTLKIPATSQGVYPLLCSDRPVFTVTSAASSGQSQLWFTEAQALGFSYQVT